MLNPDEVKYENRAGVESVTICFSDEAMDDNVATIRISIPDGMALADMLKQQCKLAEQRKSEW